MGVNFYGDTGTANLSVCGIELGANTVNNIFHGCSISGGTVTGGTAYPEVPAIVQRGYYNKFKDCFITHWGNTTLTNLVEFYGRTIIEDC